MENSNFKKVNKSISHIEIRNSEPSSPALGRIWVNRGENPPIVHSIYVSEVTSNAIKVSGVVNSNGADIEEVVIELAVEGREPVEFILTNAEDINKFKALGVSLTHSVVFLSEYTIRVKVKSSIYSDWYESTFNNLFNIYNQFNSTKWFTANSSGVGVATLQPDYMKLEIKDNTNTIIRQKQSGIDMKNTEIKTLISNIVIANTGQVAFKIISSTGSAKYTELVFGLSSGQIIMTGLYTREGGTTALPNLNTIPNQPLEIFFETNNDSFRWTIVSSNTVIYQTNWILMSLSNITGNLISSYVVRRNASFESTLYSEKKKA